MFCPLHAWVLRNVAVADAGQFGAADGGGESVMLTFYIMNALGASRVICVATQRVGFILRALCSIAAVQEHVAVNLLYDLMRVGSDGSSSSSSSSTCSSCVVDIRKIQAMLSSDLRGNSCQYMELQRLLRYFVNKVVAAIIVISTCCLCTAASNRPSTPQAAAVPPPLQLSPLAMLSSCCSASAAKACD